MKSFLTIIFLYLLGNFSSAQDLIYSISGELNDEKTAINSILVENVSNNTMILFNSLSPQDNYHINLTKKILVTANIIDYDDSPAFVESSNMPGLLTLLYKEIYPTEVSLSVYNMKGQKVYISDNNKLIGQNSINVQLGKEGIFLIKIQSPFGVQTFKSIGTSQFNKHSVEVIGEIITKTTIKSNLMPDDSDFCYSLGDSIIISIFKEGYYASPRSFRIAESKTVDFIFDYTSFFDSRNGKLYKTKKIGEQTWMAENLTYLPQINLSNNQSSSDSMYYVYGYEGNDIGEAMETENYRTYGVLYNWSAAVTACPKGWHLPTENEWNVLQNYLINNGYGYGGNSTHIAKSMAAKTSWEFSSIVGTPGYESATNDSSFFSGLPSGMRNFGGGFYGIGQEVQWWSVTEFSSSMAKTAVIFNYDPGFGTGTARKEYGYCVRCLMD